jgi:hypothetical protein
MVLRIEYCKLKGKHYITLCGEPFWKRLWTCRNTDYGMNEWINEWMNEWMNDIPCHPDYKHGDFSNCYLEADKFRGFFFLDILCCFSRLHERDETIQIATECFRSIATLSILTRMSPKMAVPFKFTEKKEFNLPNHLMLAALHFLSSLSLFIYSSACNSW